MLPGSIGLTHAGACPFGGGKIARLVSPPDRNDRNATTQPVSSARLHSGMFSKLPPTSFTTIWRANVTPALDKALDEIGKQTERVFTPIEQIGRVAVVAGLAWAIYKRLSQ